MSDPILTHSFKNGLVLLGEPMEGVESAAFTIRVPAGTAYEPESLAGLSTLSCELALRGAGERDSRQFVTDLDNLGIERDANVSDAHTSFSGATLARNLFPALTIYADVLRRPRLPADQLSAARAVVLHELSGIEDDPAQKVILELRRRHFPSPWGRPSQGREESVKAVTLDDVRRYVAGSFRPNGAIVSVAGNFDWNAVRDLVAKLYEDWAPQPASEPTLGKPGKRWEHIEQESNQTQIGIAYSSVPYRDPDYFQAWGSVGVLSGGMSCRLFTEVREKRGLCYSVYASHQTLRDRAAVLCYAGTSSERAQETLDVTLGELVRLSKGIESEELGRLKARIKSGLVMQQESTSARSAAIARDWYYLGRVRTLDEVAALVDGLSRESINAFLAEHPPRDFTIVTLGPKPLEVPVGIS
ncbi:MAG TPA: pitrilysin family protein [Pirellulales bacterium]|nr:pitrilysin family protein [Pirellulales bacterium]